eukprot:c24031_g5_i2 orf=344-967(+)
MRRLKREKEESAMAEALLEDQGIESGNTYTDSIRGDWVQTLSLEAALATLEAGQLPQPSIDDLVCISIRCRKERNIPCALCLLAYVHQWGVDAHGSLGNYLVPMLIEMECIPEARKVFDKLDYRNVHSWTCLITGYTKCGEPQRAIDVFENMLKDDSVQPNGYTYVAVLKACSELKDMKRGSEVHTKMATTGVLEKDLFVGNTLVDM